MRTRVSCASLSTKTLTCWLAVPSPFNSAVTTKLPGRRTANLNAPLDPVTVSCGACAPVIFTVAPGTGRPVPSFTTPETDPVSPAHTVVAVTRSTSERRIREMNLMPVPPPPQIEYGANLSQFLSRKSSPDRLSNGHPIHWRNRLGGAARVPKSGSRASSFLSGAPPSGSKSGFPLRRRPGPRVCCRSCQGDHGYTRQHLVGAAREAPQHALRVGGVCWLGEDFAVADDGRVCAEDDQREIIRTHPCR